MIEGFSCASRSLNLLSRDDGCLSPFVCAVCFVRSDSRPVTGSAFNFSSLRSRVHYGRLKENAVFQFGGPNCKVCRLIRVYLLVAVPVLMMMWIRPDFQIPAGIDGRAVIGYAFGVGVILMVAYKYYTDIYRKKRK